MILIEIVIKLQHLLQISPPLFFIYETTCNTFVLDRNQSCRYQTPIHVPLAQTCLTLQFSCLLAIPHRIASSHQIAIKQVALPLHKLKNYLDIVNCADINLDWTHFDNLIFPFLTIRKRLEPNHNNHLILKINK